MSVRTGLQCLWSVLQRIAVCCSELQYVALDLTEEPSFGVALLNGKSQRYGISRHSQCVNIDALPEHVNMCFEKKRVKPINADFEDVVHFSKHRFGFFLFTLVKKKNRMWLFLAIQVNSPNSLRIQQERDMRKSQGSFR